MVSHIKSPQPNDGIKIAEVLEMDNKISSWWEETPSELKLMSSSVVISDDDAFPKVLLIDILYHQSLCALHASVVPLFCWSACGVGWSAARRTSAQIAFEHALEISQLIKATLSAYPRLSAIPSFVAYAAYCGCAIQIPFMWCMNPKIRDQAHGNVKANLRLISEMADYWKFAQLLVSSQTTL